MGRSWFDMICESWSLTWYGKDMKWYDGNEKRILYYIQCWAVICYATFWYSMSIRYGRQWYDSFDMLWDEQLIDMSIVIVNIQSLYYLHTHECVRTTAKHRLYLHDLTARIQNTYIDTDHLWASRRPMPEGKFPRQARGINKHFPNNQSVP